MGFKEAREKAGLSPMAAAAKLKVSLATVYYWESGVYRPAGKRLPEIAKLYRCTIDELLDTVQCVPGASAEQNQRDRPA